MKKYLDVLDIFRWSVETTGIVLATGHMEPLKNRRSPVPAPYMGLIFLSGQASQKINLTPFGHLLTASVEFNPGRFQLGVVIESMH